MKIYQYLTRTICAGILRRASATAVAVLMMASTSLSHAENPRVVMEISGLGNIEIELLENLAPRTVSNFLTLVDEKFYDGLIFHRVIANFMIQGGGYTPDLKYKPGAKTVPNESFNGLKNSRGTIAMARLADPDSADTQFFFNVRDNPNLDADGNKAGYTVFGRVSAGMEVVSKIELVNTHLRGGMAAVPEDSVIISKVERI